MRPVKPITLTREFAHRDLADILSGYRGYMDGAELLILIILIDRAVTNRRDRS